MEKNDKARIIKDESAGKVLMAGLFLLIVEIIILGPKIIEKIFD